MGRDSFSVWKRGSRCGEGFPLRLGEGRGDIGRDSYSVWERGDMGRDSPSVWGGAGDRQMKGALPSPVRGVFQGGHHVNRKNQKSKKLA